MYGIYSCLGDYASNVPKYSATYSKKANKTSQKVKAYHFKGYVELERGKAIFVQLEVLFV